MRLGIVSDIHGNLEALEATFEVLGEVDGLLCPGDVVGYGPDPEACCELLRSRECVTVLGNHDAAVVQLTDIDWFNAIAREAVLWTSEVLPDRDIDYLKGLPLTYWSDEFVMVHGSLDSPIDFSYIYSSGPARQCFAEMKDYCLCFVGHTHVAEVYIQQMGTQAVDQLSLAQGGTLDLRPGFRYIVNCGSVGQPRDGEPKACCGIYDSDRNTVQIIRAPYDIAAVQKRIREAELPDTLATRLETGT